MKQITLELGRPPISEDAVHSIVNMVQSMKPELTRFHLTVILTQRKTEMVNGLKYVGEVAKRVADVVDQIRVHCKLRVSRTVNWNVNPIAEVVEHFCERTRCGLAKSSVLKISFYNNEEPLDIQNDMFKFVVDQDIVMIKKAAKEKYYRPELEQLLKIVQSKAAAYFPDYCYGWVGEYKVDGGKTKKIKEVERIILDKRATPELNLFNISEMSEIPVLKTTKGREEVKVEATTTLMRNTNFREKILPGFFYKGHLLLKPSRSGLRNTTVTTLLVCRINLNHALDAIQELEEEEEKDYEESKYGNQKDPIYRWQTFEDSGNEQEKAEDSDSYSCSSTSNCSDDSSSESELGDPVPTRVCRPRGLQM